MGRKLHSPVLGKEGAIGRKKDIHVVLAELGAEVGIGDSKLTLYIVCVVEECVETLGM